MHRSAFSFLAAIAIAGALVRFARAGSLDASAQTAAPTSDAAAALTNDAGADHDAGPKPFIDWLHLSPAKYQSSIVGYAPRVRPGNPRSLGESMRPFAEYLNAMHSRIHPLFSDAFLTTLDTLAPTDSLNEPSRVVELEIVLDSVGGIATLGVVQASGQLTFDVAALESVTRGAPYGVPPSVIRSEDGKTYLHWAFYRSPVHACSTVNVRPFNLSPIVDDGGMVGSSTR